MRHLATASLSMMVLLIPVAAWAQPDIQHSTITSERLVDAGKDPSNWLLYSGQYNSQRFSQLKQIHDGNVEDLRVKWVRQFPITELFETTPLVVDGVMYLTLPENIVWALDAKTGLPFWSYEHPLPDQLSLCCGKVNRGVAILGDTLYMGTLNAELVALDSKSGNVRWTVPVADGTQGFSLTGAPLIVKDMVIVGVGGGEYGIRGFVDAYDANTGKRRWRQHVIPGPGEKGHETWEGDSWKIGGASTWMTGSYDPELDLLYWGIGNPGPDWNGDVRIGDNLYSDCVLAFDTDAGTIKWHFQFTPHDVHDWDACQVPVLVDLPYQGKMRKLMLWGNRNAFYYVLDRVTGEFLHATAFAKQTWAEKIDHTGRPVRIPDTFPTKDGTLVYPDVGGAANWWSPTYSPKTELFYLMAFDGAGTYYLGAEVDHKPGLPFLGGFGTTNEFEEFPDSEYVSAVRALDPTTGNRKWEYRVQAKSTSGLVSTAGNLVFGGTVKGNFFALDSRNGTELWRLDLGGRVHAAPMTYMVDGKQYVTIAVGSALFTLGL
ncbi:MAG: PQQ-dependent dehydrogenase, methanol/ethanol family [Planctomycetota bacterium]|nr:PQQ-dependent dehydrogenase, methanol/ethanol family [Planctomycetota bacterium]